MARNDIVLLDSILAKSRSQLGTKRDDSEIFELFCFDQILKDFEASFEELETGWTDGTNDGGLDGMFVFVDGHLVTEADLGFAMKRTPHINIELFTIRRSDSFSQDALNSAHSSISELLDLTKTAADFVYPFNDDILEQRELLRFTVTTLADRHPQLTCRVHYCSRGDVKTLSNNLTSRAELIARTIGDLFGDASVEVCFIGASELLDMARRQPDYSLRLKFIESYISREGANYVVLASLPDYYHFITDEEGRLRRYLFESNVRDYLGAVQINRDIRRTLDTRKNATELDFWWLNNGVTILASHANVVGKEMSIENVQIVNGLQTTETIFDFYNENGVFDDGRAILIKILLAADEKIRGLIIKATNYQNTVDLSSIRGLDTIQRNIEDYLFDKGWYYDRRKNHYKNQGRPAHRIVSMPYLAAAVRAVALRDPSRSQRQRSSSLRDDAVYKQVFSSHWDFDVYLASLEITDAVEDVVQSRRKLTNQPPIALVHYIAFVYTCEKLGKADYQPQDVAKLAGCPPSVAEVLEIKSDLETASRGKAGRRYAGIVLSRHFIESFVQERFPLAFEGILKDVKIVAALSSSESVQAALQEVAGAFDGAKGNANRVEVVARVHDALRKAALVLRPIDQPKMTMSASLRLAALENGLPDNKIRRALRTIFFVRSRSIEAGSVSDDEMKSFMGAARMIVAALGIDTHS